MTEWRKASRSGVQGQTDCVEVAQLSGAIGQRDPKNPEAPTLSVSRGQFAAFLEKAKPNELDL
jgi:hypothetical protein